MNRKERRETKRRVRRYVKKNPGCTSSELGDGLNIDTTPYGALRKLSKEGAINRVEVEDERIEYYPPDRRHEDI
ncbi:hypothetical protein [Halorubrum halodurans]|uniref:hypothetical protein n=1 Tax=Halorubrum halodurans TaxID=1383851 RepID=UPI00117A46C0|nr:hypothetical protein [Halorubrum halodurans]